MDRIQWRDAKHFLLAGRHDELVQIGGINVSLHMVAQCLASHPSVKSCAVRKMSLDEGNRLKAFVIWHDVRFAFDQPSQCVEILETWMAERLRPVERPKHFQFGEHLPKNTLSKLADWPISSKNDGFGNVGRH